VRGDERRRAKAAHIKIQKDILGSGFGIGYKGKG
jgi:hypothetical protein